MNGDEKELLALKFLPNFYQELIGSVHEYERNLTQIICGDDCG